MVTHQIELPTKTVQDEIREKVENTGFLVDVEGGIYKPRLTEKMMTFQQTFKRNVEVIVCIDNDYIYAVDNQRIFKYERETFKLINTLVWNTATYGNIVISLNERSVGYDSEYLYLVSNVSSTDRLVKIKKSDFTFTASGNIGTSTYGYSNRIFVSGEKLFVTNANGGVAGVFIVDKQTLNITTATKVTISGYIIDILDGEDGHFYILYRTSSNNYAVILKCTLAATLVASVTTDKSLGSSNIGRLYKGNDESIFMSASSYVGKINKSTLQLTAMVDSNGASNILFYEEGKIQTFSATDKTCYITDVNENIGIKRIPIDENLTLQQLIKKDGIYYGSGQLSSRGTLFKIKESFVISHYEKEVIQ